MSHQSRKLSMLEAATNVVVGYVLALLVQLAVFPLLGFTATLLDNLLVGALFTITSILRSYTLRRLFERLSQAGE